MKTFATLSLFLLFSCTAVRAQHSVMVVAEESDADPVVAAVKARVGGTMRYHLTDNAVATELVVDIQCLMIGTAQTSFACEATVFYYPADLKMIMPLWVNVTLHKAPSADRIAQGIFESFVQDTSEERLAKVESNQIEHIRYACELHGANRDDKPDKIKTACMGRDAVTTKMSKSAP